jgi:hypothetical protein
MLLDLTVFEYGMTVFGLSLSSTMDTVNLSPARTSLQFVRLASQIIDIAPRRQDGHRRGNRLSR